MRTTRRRFLRATALGAASLSTAGLKTSPALGANALGANERLQVAVMGTNGRGSSLASSFARSDRAQVVAVCDVDERAIAKAQARVAGIRPGNSPRGEKDIRRLCDDASIDAVVVAAPNHWHAPATILACNAGKHVYVEKPCSQTAEEGEWMVAVARRHNRIVQMGNQRRSRETIIRAIEAVRSGELGRVYLSRCWYANRRGPTGKREPAASPSWLDYELWQGPAPRRPYATNTLHYKWHWFWHWGGGECGNNGVHAIDVSRWGLGVTYPERVIAAGGRYHFNDDQETPDTMTARFEFSNKTAIVWESTSCNRYGPDATAFGITFHGERGTLRLDDRGFKVFDNANKLVREVEGQEGDGPHIENFIDCIGSGKHPNADIEGGHQSTLLCHLANIAVRTSGALDCDATNGHIIDDPKAQSLWGREYAPGWKPKV